MNTKELNYHRHMVLEHKWLREDMKLADIYANLFTAGVVIFVIVTGIIKAKILGF